MVGRRRVELPGLQRSCQLGPGRPLEIEATLLGVTDIGPLPLGQGLVDLLHQVLTGRTVGHRRPQVDLGLVGLGPYEPGGPVQVGGRRSWLRRAGARRLWSTGGVGCVLEALTGGADGALGGLVVPGLRARGQFARTHGADGAVTELDELHRGLSAGSAGD